MPVAGIAIPANHGRVGKGNTAMAGYAVGDTDQRPWGRWTVLAAGVGYAVKRIEVKPGGRLSLQRHRGRAEQWVVVAGTALVTLDAAQFELAPGGTVHIAVGQVHRVENRGDADVVFIEVQTGATLDENDIERLEDIYGRA
jgi:mannose-6-phosphate isomerase-like protein (cupin superfamily)